MDSANNYALASAAHEADNGEDLKAEQAAKDADDAATAEFNRIKSACSFVTEADIEADDLQPNVTGEKVWFEAKLSVAWVQGDDFALSLRQLADKYEATKVCATGSAYDLAQQIFNRAQQRAAAACREDVTT
jgi:hypothetical protein